MVRPDVRNEKNEMYEVQFKIDEKKTVVLVRWLKENENPVKKIICFLF